MLGRLQEHKKGHKIYVEGQYCVTVSGMASYKCILGDSVPLSFEECHGREAVFAVMKDLASVSILPPNGRGERTPLGERDGLPVFHSTSVPLQTFRCFTSRPSTRIQPIVTPQCSGAIGEIDNICLYK